MSRGRVGAGANLGGHVTLLGLALAWILASVQFRYGSLLDPGPAFLPLNLGVAMAAISGWGLIQELRGSRRDDDREPIENVADPALSQPDREGMTRKVIVTTLATVLFVALLEPLGFFLAMIGLMTAYFMIGSLGFPKSLMWAVGGALGAWAIFELALGLPLPGELLDGLFGL